MMVEAKAIFQSAPDLSDATLNPSIRYLRVVIDGRVLLLALGYIDSDRLGPVEVWYSSKGEVLRLQNGHVVGLTGPSNEWLQVRLSGMPAWPAPAASSVYTRVRDVMPGYRFGVVDRLYLRAIAAPAKTHLLILKATDLRWYEEVEQGAHLPAARFALANTPTGDVPVYGEQCIAETMCLSWQQWPVVPRQ
jgi:hypothetical protein